jgi:hypothetical protein
MIGVLATGSVLQAEAPPTVWHALGLPQAYSHFRTTIPNRWGNRPGLEPKPPLKKIADPANLQSDVPAIKKAAEIKGQEDLAPQKIKAIKYLAKQGCGCYGGVADALKGALEDCTEEVRYEAALAITQALDSHCEVCNKTCCTKELAAKMYERAYERDETGCFIESSDRVRQALQEAVSICPPDMRDFEPPPPDVGPGPDILPPVDPGSTNRRLPSGPHSAPYNRQVSRSVGSDAVAQAVPMTRQLVTGEVIENKSNGFVRVQFAGDIRPAVGAQVDVYHNYLLGTERGGRLTLATYEGPVAVLAVRASQNARVSKGDLVECEVLVPEQAPTLAPAPMPVAVAMAPAGPGAAPIVSASVVRQQTQTQPRFPVASTNTIEPQNGKPVVKARPTGKFKFAVERDSATTEPAKEETESPAPVVEVSEATSIWKTHR